MMIQVTILLIRMTMVLLLKAYLDRQVILGLLELLDRRAL